jgi:hypothetical protein
VPLFAIFCRRSHPSFDSGIVLFWMSPPHTPPLTICAEPTLLYGTVGPAAVADGTSQTPISVAVTTAGAA